MKAVLQRVLSASVECEGKTVSQIEKGFMVLLGVTKTDGTEEADTLASKIAGLRIFEDENGKMNLSLDEVGGKVIVVSNFTLCADSKKGNRPSFSSAMEPQTANELYEKFCHFISARHIDVKKGVFGADMQISMVADGPVTIILDTDIWSKK